MLQGAPVFPSFLPNPGRYLVHHMPVNHPSILVFRTIAAAYCEPPMRVDVDLLPLDEHAQMFRQAIQRS